MTPKNPEICYVRYTKNGVKYTVFRVAYTLVEIALTDPGDEVKDLISWFVKFTQKLFRSLNKLIDDMFLI